MVNGYLLTMTVLTNLTKTQNINELDTMILTQMAQFC